MKITSLEDEWKIKYIPYQTKPTMVKNYGALVGASIFISGVFIPSMLGLHSHWILWICLLGLTVMFSSLLISGRSERKNWIKLEAYCIDSEIKQELSMDPEGGKTWNFRLICQYTFNGKTYRVTPDFWRSFATESGIKRFLEKNIHSNSTCQLYINPENPLQTEFVGRDIKDVLVH